MIGWGPSGDVKRSIASGTRRGALRSAFRQVTPNGWERY